MSAPQQSFLSPIILSSQVIGLGTVNGTAIQADPTQLLNPNSTAMLIDQFRFVNLSPLIQPATQQVYANIQVGALQLTNGAQPIVTLCPNYDGSNNTGSNNPFVWHLPKPLYVPPNVTIFINLIRLRNVDDPFDDSTLHMKVVIAGRSLPSTEPVPAEIYAPWATSVVVNTAQTTTLGGRQIYVSPDSALGNPNDSDLMVTRFLGYRFPLNDDATSQLDVEGPNTTTVKLTISNGKMLVREPTPFFHLFPNSRRYFDMRAVLRGRQSMGGSGGEFVRAQLSFQVPPNSDADLYDNMNLMMLGMIGYRVAPTPTGAIQGATGMDLAGSKIDALRAASVDRTPQAANLRKARIG